jgi:reactive intermediate/imine deaminase
MSKTLPPANGYSQVVTAQPGTMVFVSGQISVDPDGKIVGEGDLRVQTEQALLNLKNALASAGATFDHVVKINWYVKNLQADSLLIIREIRARYYNQQHPPANTLAGVAELYPPEALIEVEAIAVIPNKI